MVQFDILSGKKAGTRAVARHFPFRIGRAPGNELQLEDDGVWDQHLAIEFHAPDGLSRYIASNNYPKIVTIANYQIDNLLNLLKAVGATK